jgi:hypothetical protein
MASIMLLLVGSGCATSHKDASAQQTSAATSISSPAPSSEAPASASEITPKLVLTASKTADIRHQVEQNWNLGGLAGSPEVKGKVVKLRLHLQPDGTVTAVDVLNDEPGNPLFRQLADSAVRAVKISSPLKLGGKTYQSMVLIFHPDEAFD